MIYSKEMVWQATWKRSLVSLFSFLIILFLLTACSSSDDEQTEETRQPMLSVYVYSPEHPLLIRSDVGNVNSSYEESKITRLQVWVFENGTGDKVAYLDTEETSLLSVGEGAVYQIPVSDVFSQSKPNVDVYVMANIPADGYGNTLNGESTRNDVRNAVIPAGYFGLTNPTTVVPDKGLPMVGVLTDQPVTGDAPVLRIGTSSAIATARLERAVSKVRFVFGRTSGPVLKITGITMNATMIPEQEHLIPRTSTLTYNSAAAPLFTGKDSPVEVPETSDPTLFIYDGREAQEYEDLLDQYVTSEPAELAQIGPFYLRESDKQLEGKVSYQIDDVVKEPMAFRMERAGDFRRNHTWIVYAYYVGGAYLQMSAIYVKDWKTGNEKDHAIYNW